MGRRSAWSKLPPLGPGITVDPVDGALALAFVRQARARWTLSVTEALVLLATLAGYTSDDEVAHAVSCAVATSRNAKTRIRQALGAARWQQAVVRAWAVYGPLRAGLAARRVPGEEQAA